MANEKRMIVDALKKYHDSQFTPGVYEHSIFGKAALLLENSVNSVDAVEVPDKQLLRAVKLLIKQYEQSKQSDYVHNPIAHAFYHTWKELDERGYGERRDGE